jgi:hypothetical protein
MNDNGIATYRVVPIAPKCGAGIDHTIAALVTTATLAVMIDREFSATWDLWLSNEKQHNL